MSALTDYRTDRFKQRKLTFAVTPSEYPAFIQYCKGLWQFNEYEMFYETYTPDMIEARHVGLFYRGRNGRLAWHDPNDINVPDDMPAARLPFALLEYTNDRILHPRNFDETKASSLVHAELERIEQLMLSANADIAEASHRMKNVLSVFRMGGDQ